MTIKLDKPKSKLNFKTLKIIICAVFFLNLVFCISQSISFNIDSYNVSGYQQEIEDLKDNLTNLETNYSKVLKLDNIEERAITMGFQKTENIKFIMAYSKVVKAN